MSCDAKLVYLWAWSVADDEGKLMLSPRKASVHIYWGTNNIPVDASMESAFKDIEEAGLWVSYETEGGSRVAKVKDWKRLAKSPKPSPSTIQNPSDEAVELFTARHGALDTASSNRTKREVSKSDLARVFEGWKEITNQGARIRFTDDRVRAVKARLLEGITADEILAACSGVMEKDWYVSKGLTDLAWICKLGSRVQMFATGGNSNDDSDEDIQRLIREQQASVAARPVRRGRRRLSEVRRTQ